jgi:hypothetical protein
MQLATAGDVVQDFLSPDAIAVSAKQASARSADASPSTELPMMETIHRKFFDPSRYARMQPFTYRSALSEIDLAFIAVLPSVVPAGHVWPAFWYLIASLPVGLAVRRVRRPPCVRRAFQ